MKKLKNTESAQLCVRVCLFVCLTYPPVPSGQHVAVSEQPVWINPHAADRHELTRAGRWRWCTRLPADGATRPLADFSSGRPQPDARRASCILAHAIDTHINFCCRLWISSSDVPGFLMPSALSHEMPSCCCISFVLAGQFSIGPWRGEVKISVCGYDSPPFEVAPDGCYPGGGGGGGLLFSDKAS